MQIDEKVSRKLLADFVKDARAKDFRLSEWERTQFLVTLERMVENKQGINDLSEKQTVIYDRLESKIYAT